MNAGTETETRQRHSGEQQGWDRREQGAQSGCEHPTAWLADGLLPHLPEPTERALFVQRSHYLTAQQSNVANTGEQT